jgi:hypothetical protein
MKNQKQKCYLTAKRKWEGKKRRAFVIVSALLIGICVIAVAYIQLLSQFQFQIVDTARAEINHQTPVKEKELTIKEQVWELLTKEGGLSFDEATQGMAIINCESRWNKDAFNATSNDFGLWQINYQHQIKTGKTTIACSMDAYCSTRFALKLYKEWHNTFNAWTCNK